MQTMPVIALHLFLYFCNAARGLSGQIPEIFQTIWCAAKTTMSSVALQINGLVSIW